MINVIYNQMSNCYILSFNYRIRPCKAEPSLESIAAATTGLFMPQALPSAFLLQMKQYGIPLYLHIDGNIMTISRGSQSAAITTISISFFVMLFKIQLTPFLTCFIVNNCCSVSKIFTVSFKSQTGSGLSTFSPFSQTNCFSYLATSSILKYSASSCSISILFLNKLLID